MPKKINISGLRFGRLLVVRELPKRGRDITWECLCDCGEIATVSTDRLRRGVTKSCGCLFSELLSQRNTTHGQYRSPEHQTWRGMNERCSNPSHSDYHRYGGRGIRVCERWSSFELFLSDMGKRPNGTQIERIDNDGNYEPGNCRWATIREQSRNKSTNHLVEYRGETMVLVDAYKKAGIGRQAFSARLRRGWSVEMALNTPIPTRAAA